MNSKVFNEIMSLLYKVDDIKNKIEDPTTNTIILNETKIKLEDKIYKLVMNNDCSSN